MMKILTLVLILPCILQISVCSPNQPHHMRGMEVAESRGILTSIRDFFGFGPKRPQAGAQKRERPHRPRPHRRPPQPPHFNGPRPQALYLPHGHVEVPQYEQPQENHIQINIRHEGFTEPEEEVYGGQDSNYNIVSVNHNEIDPSEFAPPLPEDIIYNSNKPEQFETVQPTFSQHLIREEPQNEGTFVNIHDKGSVFWPEDREIHDNNLNSNKHNGFSFPKPEDKMPSHISQSSEENKGISEFFVTNDAHPNIVDTQDFNNFDISPKPFVESNSVKNSDESNSPISGSSDAFNGVFSNFFSSSLGSFGFQPDTASFTTQRPKVVFDLTTYVPPGYTRDSTTKMTNRFNFNDYSPPIYRPTTTSSTTPSTTTVKAVPAYSRKPYFNIAPEIIKQKINKPSLTPDLRDKDNNNDDVNNASNNNNNDNSFNFQNTQKINSTSFSEQVWHLPTKKPLTKSSSTERQQNRYTINKAVSLLESTIRYDSTAPTITTYKPRKVTQDILKTKRPDRLRNVIPARYTTKRPKAVSSTTVKSRATLPTLKPYIPPRGTPQRTRPPPIYKSIPRIVSHTTTTPSPPPSTTTTTTTSTTPTTTTTAASTTYRPKRNPDPRITPNIGWKQPQQYNIAVTNNTKYYSNEKPPIVDFDENFSKPFDFDSFVPYKSSDEFFQTIFGDGNPLQQIPSDEETRTEPAFKSGELVYQSSNSKNPNENLRQGSSEFSRPFAPFNKQPISSSGLIEPSFSHGVTKYDVSSDTTERPSQQPQLKQIQNIQPQVNGHDSQRVPSRPRYTQYIRRGTTPNQYISPSTELPKKSATTTEDDDSQHLVFEGREQIDDDFSANRVSNFPAKTPTRINLIKQTKNTKNTDNSPQLQIDNSNYQDNPKTGPHKQDKEESLPFDRPMATSWNSQQSSHHRASPSPNEHFQTQRDFTPQRYERPQPTLPPLHYTTHTKDSSPYTEYKVLGHTSPGPKPVSSSQTSPEFISQSAPATISPPQGVIIGNQFSKEPTFHFGGGYHNWEDFSSTSVDSKDVVYTTAKPATTLAFSVNSPLSTTYSTSYDTPRSTKYTASTSWVSLPTERSNLPDFDAVFDQGNFGNHQEISGEEMEFEKGTTQFVYYEDTTIPPGIQEQYEIQPEDSRFQSNTDNSWGTKNSNNGNIVPKAESSPGNNYQRDEGEVPVILVRGSSRPPNNVWTPPTPPSSVTPRSRDTSRGSYRPRRPDSRRPSIRRRPTPAVAPSKDISAVPRNPAVGAISNIRRQQPNGRDGLGWNSFPVPLMDLSVSSDMQEMMSQLDGGSMDFMKLPSRGDQKSLSMPSSRESPIQFDYEDDGADIPVIPKALEGALEQNYENIYSSQISDESHEDANNANKDSFKRSPTEDTHQQTCVHGFCEEEFLNTDNK